MMGRTHLAAGMTLAAAGTLIPETLLHHGLFGIGALFGSLLPDLDHPKSKLGRIMLPVSLPLNIIFGHRGGTHSLLFILLCLLPAILEPSLAYGLSLGVMVHILLDVVSHSSTWYRSTTGGCPLFYPVSKKRISIKAVKVGGVVETFAIAPVFFLAALMLLSVS